MTASVENPTSQGRPRSRRALLAGALGGIGAWAAAALDRAGAVRAANGDPVLVGGTYTSTSVTKISGITNDQAVFWAENTQGGDGLQGSSLAGTAVSATSTYGPGVQGGSSSNAGVVGNSDTSTGVAGGSTSGVGVRGDSLGSKPGCLGVSAGNTTGVQSYSGDPVIGPPIPLAKAKTGVYGYAAQDSASRGVIGESPAGIGVLGQTSSSGVGVRAYCGNNTGVGLRVTGKAAFDRSGKLTITAGHSSLTKTGIGLTSASFILATLQTNVAGLFVQAVVTHPSSSSFTVYLNKAPAINVAVAWMAVN